ncbi:hypothetical protein BDFB_009752, partial [Asbolus verrucosus]
MPQKHHSQPKKELNDVLKYYSQIHTSAGNLCKEIIIRGFCISPLGVLSELTGRRQDLQEAKVVPCIVKISTEIMELLAYR